MEQLMHWLGREEAVWVTSFLSACFAVLAVGAFLGGMLARHPHLLAAHRERQAEDGGLFAFWCLLKDVGAQLVEGDRLSGMKAKIADHQVKAGRPTDETPETFLGLGQAQGLALGAAFVVMSLLLWGRTNVILAVGLMIAWAFLIRPSQLRTAAETRVRFISRRLPFGIDLAILVLEAGGTLGEALNILAEAEEGDALGEEMRLVLEGTKAGQTQSRALQDMADRLGIEDLATLVMAINRGEEMGASMKTTLQTQGELMRFRRYERAEKIAAEAPVKMMVPNMIIMMATLLVVMGPMILKMAKGEY